MQAEKRKSNSTTTVNADVERGELTITVLGEKGSTVGSLVFNVLAIAGEAYHGLSEVGKFGILHGFEQKLRDRAAIERDDKTGKSASPETKFEAIKTLADHLANGGQWAMKGGGPRPLDRAALYQAVAVARKRDARDVESLYRSKEDVVLRTLLSDGAIAAEYARLTARGDQGKANELLSELEEVTEQVE